MNAVEQRYVNKCVKILLEVTYARVKMDTEKKEINVLVSYANTFR